MWSHKKILKLKIESKIAEEKSHPGGSICLAFNARTEHGSGAERPKWAASGRLNARIAPWRRANAERPEQAWFWRSTPEMGNK